MSLEESKKKPIRKSMSFKLVLLTSKRKNNEEDLNFLLSFTSMLKRNAIFMNPNKISRKKKKMKRVKIKLF